LWLRVVGVGDQILAVVAVLEVIELEPG
jgi:hypothetical protein